MKLLVASRNAKKLAELERVLDAADLGGIEVIGLGDVDAYEEVPETGATFADNALLKAREGAQHTGLVTIADDSGLRVDALNGMPGVLSARWSGRHGTDEENLQLVLAQLADVPAERRGAEFCSAVAIVVPPALIADHQQKFAAAQMPDEFVVEGVWRGQIIHAKQGENGFGYDPIFRPDDADGRTSAELSAEEKDARSHRGQALRAVVPVLTALADVLS